MKNSITTRRCLTISEKQEILKTVDRAIKEEQLGASELAKRLNIPRSTISSIVNKRSVIESTPKTELARLRSRAVNRKPKLRRYEELEARLEKWLEQQDRQQINGTVLREKAKMFAREMKIDGFTASNGWFTRFSKRCGTVRKQHLPCQHVNPKNMEKIRSSDFLNNIPKIPISSQNIKSQYEILSKNLYQWENIVRSEGIKITRSLLKDMAFALAGALDITSFTASNSWLAKYQKQRSTNCEKCLKIT